MTTEQNAQDPFRDDILARLSAWAETMPDEPFLHGMRAYTPRELVREIRDRTPLGERFLATWREMEER